VRASKVDLGIALDGDGDRCILVDERAALVHGDGILTLMGRHLQSLGRLAASRVVATVMSNRGLHRALREVGVEVVSVGVGDRRVVEALKRDQLSLGGEQSGHIVFGAENHYLGDGIFTALRVLSVMGATRAPLSALAAPYVPVPQVLLNVPVKKKPRFADVPGLSELVHSIEAALGQDGRVLLRYSGTEPLARVMVEGPDDAWIRERAHALAATIERAMGV
jgi:phosphoglucosamine mutase